MSALFSSSWYLWFEGDFYALGGGRRAAWCGGEASVHRCGAGNTSALVIVLAFVWLLAG